MLDKIMILMATFNGERYLSQQLDSIVNQTYENWELWIRDDNSTDNTAKILNDFAKRNDRIKIYRDELGNLGCAENFSTLLKNVPYKNYVMFSDQDDIWLPLKIETTMEKMKNVEKDNKGVVLVFTNFKKVDSSLNELNVKNISLPETTTINKTISQNYIYGCTMMLNKDLVQLVNPISHLAENHDYWIALIASYHGAVGYLDQATLLYRQHANNVSGNYKNSSLKLRLNRILMDRKRQAVIRKNKVKMIESLIYHLKNKRLDVDFLEEYLKATKSGGIKAVYFILKHRLFKYGTGPGSNILNIITAYHFRYSD